MEKAIAAVRENELSLRRAAEVYGVKHTALFYRLEKQPREQVFSSKHTFRQVFNQDQELMLVKYILTCSKLQYGLSYNNLRVLAFDYAKAMIIKYPPSWDTNKMAGLDWVQGFMKRHSNLSLRRPENTSMSRVTAFNQTALTEFQDDLVRCFEKYTFPAHKIFNLDETGITTVVDAPNIIAAKGTKQVGQVTSAERGTLVTMCAIVSADGNSLPPAFIFPRARYHDSFLTGAPAGSIGLINNPPSGWMTKALFIKVLEHIKTFTKCTPNEKILIIMDNHESHCSLDAIRFAKENGMEIVTIPPHCSHRLQPLDVSIMAPFKAKLKIAQHDYLISNPGKTITIHDLSGLANIAIQASFTPKNIISGFQKTGIWPLNRNIFSDSDFVAAGKASNNNAVTEIPDGQNDPITSASAAPITAAEAISTAVLTDPEVMSPEVVRPLPDICSTNKRRRSRKTKKSLFLTDTPIKDGIEAEALAREAKKRAQTVAKRPKVKKAIFVESDSSCDDAISLHDESEYDFDQSSSSDKNEDSSNLSSDVQINNYVLVRFCTKKTLVHYVGQVIGQNEDDYVKVFKEKTTEVLFSNS